MKKVFAPIPLKIKENLWIKGNTIISYETEVATIKGDTIFEHGKFTRTTTKHIHSIASMFGLKVKGDSKKAGVRFWKFEQGVKCDSPVPRAITQSLTAKASEVFHEAEGDIINAISAVERIGKKDLDLIKSYYEKNGIPWRAFELSQWYHKHKKLM